MIRAFGLWSSATRAYEGTAEALTARQRAHLRAARRGVFRDRDDYLNGLRAWLATDPPSETPQDYDAWRQEHNAALPDEEHPLVSHSMLRKGLPWSWETMKDVARRLVAPEVAAKRPALTASERSGPHDLVGFKTVCDLFQLGRTAARNLTYSHSFPKPAYKQRRPPGIRLWRRSDILAFQAGTPPATRDHDDLQDFYLDAHGVAAVLGLSRYTVTTRSSARVPEPTVLVAGLQLWARQDIENEPSGC